MNETKIDESKLKDCKYETMWEDKYRTFWNCCKNKPGYSGVAIFTKYKPISITYGIGSKQHDEEGRVLTMEFEKFYIVACYTPSSGDVILFFNT